MKQTAVFENVHSLSHLLEDCLARFEGNPLFRFERGGEELCVHYGEFYHLVHGIARGLLTLAPEQRRVALVGETSVEWIATYLATVLSGGVIVPMDAALDKTQFPAFVREAECNLVAASDHWQASIAEHRAEMPGVTHVLRLCEERFSPEGPAPETIATVADLYRLGARLRIALPTPDPETCRILLFTSGTTGSSKGVMLCERNLCAVINGGHRLLGEIREDDVLLTVLPIHHTYEMSCGILAVMSFGSTICINDTLSHVAKNIKKYKPTVMTLVPLFIETLYKTIMNKIEKQGKLRAFAFGKVVSRVALTFGIDLRHKLFAQIREGLGGRLRYIVSGAAALNPKYTDLFEAIGVRIIQGYGITECAPLIAAVPFSVYKPASCGKPIDTLQVSIEKEKPSDAVGEIVVRGENVMLGYYKNKEATDEVLKDGCFHTGDIGYMDKKGYLYITGRKKNVIVLPGGKNVFPEEIEEYLYTIPLISECVVLGREDEDKNITLCAVVYPNLELAQTLGLTPEALATTLRTQIGEVSHKLSSYKRIDTVELRSEPFEKTTTRKIKRFLVQ